MGKKVQELRYFEDWEIAPGTRVKFDYRGAPNKAAWAG